MCNDFGNHVPYSDYIAAFSQTRIPVRWPKAAPNLEPREDIWPTDKAPVIRRLEDGTNQFSELRWGFPPARPKGAPIINFRSESRRFPVGRCLEPASHFFEFTGAKSPKTKWKFTKADEDSFCFAGLWRPMAVGGEAFTLLTTEPSPDVAPIHDRQMVVLERARLVGMAGADRQRGEARSALVVAKRLALPCGARFSTSTGIPLRRQSARPPKARFALDSALEGGGFEPSVPRKSDPPRPLPAPLGRNRYKPG